MTKRQKATRIVAGIASLLVLALVIGGLAYFTNGFTEDISNLYLQIGDEKVTHTGKDFMLPLNRSTKIDVKQNFTSQEELEYTVKIVPNVVEGKNFNLMIDGLPFSYQDEEDFTKGFDIEQHPDHFVITPKGDLTEVMRAVYEGMEVADCSGNAYENMFKLVVSTVDDEDTVEVMFSLYAYPTGIQLDVEEIKF